MARPTLAFCNSSPIISLQRIDRLDLLDGHFTTLVVPPTVAREVGFVPAFAVVWPLPEVAGRPRYPNAIHPGESEVITLGLVRPEAVLLLDDEPARRYAMARSLDVVGTLGILIRCKNHGRISQVRPLVDALIEMKVRFSPAVRLLALRIAGEAP